MSSESVEAAYREWIFKDLPRSEWADSKLAASEDFRAGAAWMKAEAAKKVREIGGDCGGHLAPIGKALANFCATAIEQIGAPHAP